MISFVTGLTARKSVYLFSPYWHNMGGGESYLLHLAAALSKLPNVAVTLLSTSSSIPRRNLEDYFNLDLSGINYCVIKDNSRALREAVNNADIFLPLSNYKRIEADPKIYVQALQIPYPKINNKTILKEFLALRIKKSIKDAYRMKLLSETRKSSALTLTNSQFVRETLQKNFAIQSEVLYPPINDFYDPNAVKTKSILSVGRLFKGLYNDKRYDILTGAFRELIKKLPGWEYHIVGSDSKDKKSAAFLDELRESNRACPVFFHTNVPYDQLKTFYNLATIYWHGAGFGVNEEQHPEATEHFGMSVVEAMSAGCIPLVVNKGGLKEIVSSGTDGFTWDTANELISRTIQIAQATNEEKGRLSDQARVKAREFSVESFDQRVAQLFTPILQ